MTGQPRDRWQEQGQGGAGAPDGRASAAGAATLSPGHGAVLGDTGALGQGHEADRSCPGFRGEGPGPAPRGPGDGASAGRAVTDTSPLTHTKLRLPGNISKNCTSGGWSPVFPDFADACRYEDPEDSQVGLRAPGFAVRPQGPCGWRLPRRGAQSSAQHAVPPDPARPRSRTRGRHRGRGSV